VVPPRLNPGDLLKVAVTVPVEAEEPVAALLERLFGQAPALYTDEETLRTEVSVFLEAARPFSARRRARLGRALERLHAAGLLPRRVRVRLRRVPHRNWAEAWKRHFRPLEVARRLLVLPTWSRRRARPGQVEVRLDPGLSFGTGQHPTTAFCLEEIVRLAPAPRGGPPRALLDIGTGSGVLALAAAKLGYAPVEAFDFDPAAVRAARANAALNGLAGRIRIARRDLRRLPPRPARQFDVVCANLLADLLLAERDRLTARVAPGGTLVLAGILAAEFREVRAAYAMAGWRVVRARTAGEWRSGSFQRETAAPGCPAE
jgi:ribosomal protein L11 methyltransferase